MWVDVIYVDYGVELFICVSLCLQLVGFDWKEWFEMFQSIVDLKSIVEVIVIGFVIFQ